MRTDVIQAVHFPIDVPKQHHLLPQYLHSYRLVLYQLRDPCIEYEDHKALLNTFMQEKHLQEKAKKIVCLLSYNFVVADLSSASKRSKTFLVSADLWAIQS